MDGRTVTCDRQRTAGWSSLLMAWARIDDAFDDHPKVLALLEHEHGGAAIGLWTLCLAWANRNTRRKGQTPGLIPAALPRRFLGPGARELAALLVEVRAPGSGTGLWEDRGSDGWMIHDFDDYLPTKETSAARSDAGKRGAAARWAGHQKTAGRDGNLPSGDGKSIATGMANDGTSAANGTRPGEGAPEPAPGTDEHGNQPSDDGNLPSGSHDPMANPMANDGSRAPARWAISNEIAPTPEPIPNVPPTAGAEKPRRTRRREPANAGDVVAAYVEGAVAAGLPRPDESLRKRIGKQAGDMLARGEITIEVLMTAARNSGAGGWNDLAVQVQRDAAAKANNGGKPGAHQPYRNPDSPDAYEGTT